MHGLTRLDSRDEMMNTTLDDSDNSASVIMSKKTRLLARGKASREAAEESGRFVADAKEEGVVLGG